MALTVEDYQRYIDALEEMMAKGYKRYKVDSEVTFEFFSTDEMIQKIIYFKDKIAEIEGKSFGGSNFVKKKGFNK